MSSVAPISFLVRAPDGAVAPAQATLASLQSQSDDGWEMLLYGDGLGLDLLGSDVLGAGEAPVRIVAGGGSPSELAREATWAASGEIVCLLDAGVRVGSDAVALIREAVDDHPEAGLFYGDEAAVDAAGDLVEVVGRPIWSPARLRGHHYLQHLVLIRTELLRSVLGSRDLPAAAVLGHDLVLRSAEAAHGIVRIPSVLVARAPMVSDSITADSWDASVAAVQDHLDRLGRRATAGRGAMPGTVCIDRWIDRDRAISVIIPTDGRTGLVRGERRRYVVDAVRSLLASSYPQRLQIVVVHSTTCPQRVLDDLRDLAGDALTLLPFGKPFHVTSMINHAVAATNGEVLVLLNERAEASSSDFLGQLVAPLDDAEVGMTGPLEQTAGMTLVGTGLAVYANRVSPMYHGSVEGEAAEELMVSREVSALDGTCVALHRTTFEAVGGVTEGLPALWSIDLSLKIARHGLSRLWVRSCRLTSFVDPRVQPWPDPDERKLLFQRWLAPEMDDYAPVYGRRLVHRRRDDRSRWR